MSLLRNPIVRKLKNKWYRYCFSLSHRFGLLDSEGERIVLCNSIPKSGTHLLLQILQGIQLGRYRGGFVASIPSVSFRERSDGQILRKVRSILPGELIPAHLHWSAGVADELKNRSCVHFLMIRDPRDVLVSEVNYLTHMARWHGMSKHFRALKSEEERIELAIRGGHGSLGLHYPSLAQRLAKFIGWIEQDDACVVRFEKLVGEGREEQILSIIDEGFDIDALDKARLLGLANEAIAPEKSHTFHTGKVGSGAEKIPNGLLDEINSTCRHELAALGY